MLACNADAGQCFLVLHHVHAQALPTGGPKAACPVSLSWPAMQGDISGNTFAGNTAPSGSAIFRTVSSGDVSSNKRLQDSQVELDNPASN